MGAFRCLVAVLLIEIGYVFLPENFQADAAWYVSQGQFVLAMFGALLAYSYRHPLGKGSLLIGFLWSVTLVATDWWIPYEPIWGPAVAPVGFLLWLLWMWWRHDDVSGGKETGQSDGDSPLPVPGQGWRRGSRWK